jgi:ribonucleoside-diphosphate reductase alpha chain
MFLNPAGKVGTDLEAHARDAAITASLCLQHGCPLDALRKALTRTGNGGPGSALSFVLDQLAAEGGAP